MKKKKIKGALRISLLLFLIYFFFFTYSTGKEPVLMPSWIINLEDEQELSVLPPERSTIQPFRINNKFGYADIDGKLYYKDTVQYNTTLSAKGFINYSSIQTIDQNLILFNPAGDFIKSFPMTGYPLLSKDGKRLFLIHINGAGIKEIDEMGDELWQSDFAKQITTMAVSSEFVCLGFANGLLQIYDQKGNVVYELFPKRSRISIILGCAVNNTGNKIAAIYGINPQYLIYIEKGEKKYQNPIFYEISTDFRREVFLDFSPDSDYLFIEGKKRIYSFKIQSRKLSEIILPGEFHSLSSSVNCKYFTAVSREADKNILHVWKPDNRIIMNQEFKADHIFNQLVDNHLFLGLDNYLVKLDLQEL